MNIKLYTGNTLKFTRVRHPSPPFYTQFILKGDTMSDLTTQTNQGYVQVEGQDGPAGAIDGTDCEVLYFGLLLRSGDLDEDFVEWYVDNYGTTDIDTDKVIELSSVDEKDIPLLVCSLAKDMVE